MVSFRKRGWRWGTFCALLAAGFVPAQADGIADLLGQSRWRPVASATAPRQEDGGVVFDVPFRRLSDDRFYWDLNRDLDLSGVSVLALDLSIDRPESLRSLALYFQSGDGWYIWNRPLPRAGRQTLRLALSDFSTEGNPSGWHRITRVRISPWRGASLDARLILHGMAARNASVLVLQGTQSNAGAAELRVAEVVARRVSAWLDRTGIGHRRVQEEAFPHAPLDGVRTIILPYNAVLPDAVRSRIRDFIRRGGRLIVCYSSDARLAQWMGFRLGEYVRADRPGRWSSFRFEDPARWETPDRIWQQSVNLRPAWPVRRDARVIAWWENAQGEPAPEPAWVASDQGLWMSHILRPDDGVGKAAMLAGFLVTLDPGLWPEVAEALIDAAGRIDSFAGVAEATTTIRRLAQGHPDERIILNRVADALRVQARLHQKRAAGNYVGTGSDALRMRALLTEAYGRIQAPLPGEFRGVWDHSGAGWFPGDWDRTAEILAAQGITAVFPNLLWAGRAHFPSETLPGSQTLRLHGDQAQASVRAARRHGLEVHVWKVCWNLAAAPAEWIETLRKEGRLQMDAQGRTTNWLCPAHPDNIEYELAGLRELVRRYAPDGVHLDYIRFPDRNHCFSPISRRAFEKHRGRSVSLWPGDVAPGGRWREEYEAWRREIMTAYVRRVRDELRAIQPSIRLSVAVFGGAEDARVTIGQDWMEWLRQGLVDFVTPMNYTDQLAMFTTLTQRQLEAAGSAADRIYPGIGVSSNEAALAPDQVIEQISRGRSLGARGFMLFDLNTDLREHTLPALRLGLTKE